MVGEKKKPTIRDRLGQQNHPRVRRGLKPTLGEMDAGRTGNTCARCHLGKRWEGKKSEGREDFCCGGKDEENNYKVGQSPSSQKASLKQERREIKSRERGCQTHEGKVL